MTSHDHTPVLLNQVIKLLSPAPGKIFIDCTLGAGGHAREILKNLQGKGAVYGIDADERNLNLAREKLSSYKNIHYIHGNFENLEIFGREILKKEKRIDGILFDLGLSSLHIDEAKRGFSFQIAGPLDMRFDATKGLTAADIINTYPFEKLLFIFKTYGEEKYSYRIAKKIVRHRKRERFATTSQLADFIRGVVSQRGKYPYHRVNPAVRIFQALRIAANREIGVLEKGLAAAIKIISAGGRIAVISFHSIEDRVVKNLFRDAKKEGMLKILTKKPIQPNEEELQRNRRSRSAKLRVAEKIFAEGL